MRHFASLMFLGSSLLVACVAKSSSDPGTDTDTAANAVDSSDTLGAEGDMIVVAMDGADATSLAPPTPESIASRIAANVAARWQPAGCAVATVSAGSVSIAYSDCSGPGGLVHVTGTLGLDITHATGDIAVSANADLMVNNASVSFMATASLASTATGHTLSVQTSGSATGPRGNEITHDGNVSVAWDSSSQCRDLTGTYSTEVSAGSASLSRSTDISLERCGGGCPTGTLTRQLPLGKTLAVTFDGTPLATWVRGALSGTINLLCQ